MKKFIYNILAGVMILSSIVACNNDKDEVDGNGTDERVAVVINSGIPTKATDNIWQPGDEIGVTMYNADTTAIIDNQRNRPYITQSNGTDGIFNATTNLQVIYFPQNGEQVSIRAYYPYLSTLGTDMLYPVSVADQSDLPAIDLMTSEQRSGFSNSDTDVWLHFYHRLSKLIFIMELADTESTAIDLSQFDLTIRGMYTRNTYDLFADGFLTQQSNMLNISVPLRTIETQASQRTAIVLPRMAGRGVVFEFDYPGGDTYEANMPEDLTLEGGKQYTFRVLLSKHAVADVRVTIEPWEDGGNQTIVAQ